MAERTVNVRINYQVNTADVQKATAASIAAQKATDDLRKTTEAYGKATVKANRDAAKSTQDLTKDFADLQSAVKLVISGGLVKEIVGATLEMAKLSGQIEGVARAFNRLPNATVLLSDLQKATHGTVGDLQLMQKALQASNFRIPLEKLGKLFEFAAVKAQQTGQEVNHLVDYIVSGIGFRSIKRLDDLGFTANRVKEALGGVSLQAASMGQVMDAVTKLMDEDLQRTGGYAETTATQVEQIETKWAKLKTTVSTILTSPAVIKFYQSVLDNLNRGADVIAGTADQNAAKERALKESSDIKQRLLTKEILQDKQKTFDVIQQEANTLQQNIGRNNDAIRQAREQLDLINKIYTGEADRNDLYGDRFSLEGKNLQQRKKANIEFSETIRRDEEELRNQIESYNFRNLITKETIKILGEYNAALGIGTEEEMKQLGIIEAKKAEIEALQDQIESTTNKSDLGPSGRLTKALKKAQEELETLLGKTKEKKQKDTNEVAEYLANLSDLEMFQVKTLLAERQEAREEDIENEKKALEEKKKLQKEYNEWLSAVQAEVAQVGIDLVNDQLQSLIRSDTDAIDARISKLKDFYDTQIELAGDNRIAVKELRQKEDAELRDLEKVRADREKKSAQAGILVSTALGIMKVFAGEGTYIDKIIRAAIVAAEGASQFAIASRARYYAKGEVNIDGPGTSTSDSIPAYLSKGESVINAAATRRSMGILEMVQANKLDDRILKNIDFSGGRTINASMNDERIVKELKAIRQSQFDLERQGRVLYRVYKDGEGNKKRVRSRSING